MPKSQKNINYTNGQAFLLVTLRVLMGWYFLYEGITKLANPDWSSLGYLMDSKGPASAMFHSMASNGHVVAVADWLNMWGLTLIGLGLLLGIMTQLSIFFGIILLVLYYLSHPALASVNYIMPQEGSYLIVNKTLIEIFAMAVLYVFPTGQIVGLDRIISKWTKTR
jgi:thiosulfate dehydrogenase (quinone) large subunit